MHGEHKRSAFPGILLIALGVFFILVKLDILDWRIDHLWTYLIMIVGAAFWVRFLFEKEKPGVLMPGTILLTIGLMFNYASRNGWHTMEHLWPFFILAPAFGFYALFFIRGQSCFRQRSTASSSRSRACRSGFWQLQPSLPSNRHTPDSQ